MISSSWGDGIFSYLRAWFDIKPENSLRGLQCLALVVPSKAAVRCYKRFLNEFAKASELITFSITIIAACVGVSPKPLTVLHEFVYTGVATNCSACQKVCQNTRADVWTQKTCDTQNKLFERRSAFLSCSSIYFSHAILTSHEHIVKYTVTMQHLRFWSFALLAEFGLLTNADPVVVRRIGLVPGLSR